MIEELLAQYDKNLDYARRLVADLGDEQMAACPHGTAMNHAAWVVGHLAFVTYVYARMLGEPGDAPAGYGRLFGGKSRPEPGTGQYPPKAELLGTLEQRHAQMARLVRGKPPSYWNEPPTDEKFRQRFATMGDALVHMLVHHEAVHLGQLSAWRRVNGLPPVSNAVSSAGRALSGMLPLGEEKTALGPDAEEVSSQHRQFLAAQHEDEAATLRPVMVQASTSVSAYQDREIDEGWLDAAQHRIEKIRMADLRITVTGASGAALPGIAVKARMKRHAFLWGSAFSDRVFHPTDGHTESNRQRYLDEFARLFSLAVIERGLRWPHWEKRELREPLHRMMRWCDDRAIRLHGHTLVYPGWSHVPSDLQGLKDHPSSMRKRIDDHLRDQVSSLAGRFVSWDVLNEPYSLNDLQRVVGEDQMAHWFRVVRETDPVPALVVNENNVVSSGVKIDGFCRVVRRLLDDGAPLDAIGVQGHFRGSYFGSSNPIPLPQIWWDRFERMGSFGLPLRVSEFDIFNDRSDHSMLFNEADQERLTREFTITAFSHPSVQSFTLWGFWDGAHWMKNAPLFTTDWTVKPSGQAWLDLVFNRWWTNAEAITGGDGGAIIRGYLGDYDVEVTGPSGPLRLCCALPREGVHVLARID